MEKFKFNVCIKISPLFKPCSFILRSLSIFAPLIYNYASDEYECCRHSACGARQRRVPNQISDSEKERRKTDDKRRVNPLVAAGEARVLCAVWTTAVTLQHEITRDDLEHAWDNKDQEETEQASHRKDKIYTNAKKKLLCVYLFNYTFECNVKWYINEIKVLKTVAIES